MQHTLLHKLTHDPVLDGLSRAEAQAVIGILVLALHGDGDPRHSEVWEFYYRLAALRDSWFGDSVDDLMSHQIVRVAEARKNGDLSKLARELALEVPKDPSTRGHLYRLACSVVLADRSMSPAETDVTVALRQALGVGSEEAERIHAEELRSFVSDAYRLVD
jgi:hypothetical protein